MRRKVASVLLISSTCKYPLNHFTGSAGIHVYMYIFIYIYTHKKNTQMLATVQAIASSMLPHTTDLCGGPWKQRTQHHKSIADQKDDTEDPRNAG